MLTIVISDDLEVEPRVEHWLKRSCTKLGDIYGNAASSAAYHQMGGARSHTRVMLPSHMLAHTKYIPSEFIIYTLRCTSGSYLYSNRS